MIDLYINLVSWNLAVISLLVLGGFCFVCFQIFLHRKYVICKYGQFFFSFLRYMTFVSFSSLIAWVRMSSTMMKNNKERRHPYLVPDLSVKTLVFFTIKYNVSCRFFGDVVYQVEETSLNSLFAYSFVFLFIKNGLWILSYALSASIWYNHVIFLITPLDYTNWTNVVIAIDCITRNFCVEIPDVEVSPLGGD